MKKLLTLLAIWLGLAIPAIAQTVTSLPTPLKETSEGVVIYFHADRGNKGLLNQPSTAQIYAHTGCITTESRTDSDWKYAPSWGDNSEKYKLEFVEANLWKLNIGNIRTYYGITDPNVAVKQLAFVFRTADTKTEAKDTGDKDIFIDVETSKLLLKISTTLDGTVVIPGKETVTFTLTANQPADLELLLNGKSLKAATNVTSISAVHTFTETGSYTVTGKGSAEAQSAETSTDIIFPEASLAADYPGGIPQMGTVRNVDGSVTFCFGAPQKSSVIIVGSWDNYQTLPQRAMAYQDYKGYRYFWITIPGLEECKDYPYYYLVDGQYRVADPYARLVLDPWNDRYISADVYPELPAYPAALHDEVCLAVYRSDINAYDWKVTDFKGCAPENLMIYELLLRDFTGTEGQAKGNGTVRLAMEKIGYLKQLGINAVELLPINEFNGNISWGYNPNFYFAPDKAYGTPDDYKAFIDLCHENGIAVILDMVFNQTDWLHPWYQMYPIGQNPFYNPEAPHAYSVLNDWNQGNEMLQKHFEDCLKYWVTEYKVDGFRFDLVKGLGDNNSYADSGDAATNAYNLSRVLRMRALQSALNEVKPDAYFINENLADTKEENEMAETGQLNWANINWSGRKFAEGNQTGSGLNRMYAPLDNSRKRGSTVSYLESHDEQRLAYSQNVDGVKGVAGNLAVSMHRLGSAAAQMILSPGAHMIWQFSELGNYDNTKNSTGGNNTDPKTVRWNLFDIPARHGLYEDYAALCRLRLANPELFGNNSTVSENCGDANWANGRTIVLKNGNQEIYLAVNPKVDGTPLDIKLPLSSSDGAYALMAKSYNTNPKFDAQTGTVTIEPNCFAVIGRNLESGICEFESDSNETGDGNIYNILGQRIDNPTIPGIYIRNGRKFIIR